MRPRATGLLPAVSLLAAAAAWEAVARSGAYSRHLFPPPADVVRALYAYHLSGELWTDLGASSLRLGTGLLAGNALGVFVGVLTGWLTPLRRGASPLLHLLRTIPFVVLIPLAILWLGLGEAEKIVLVSWGAFFPVWLSAQTGIGRIPQQHVWAARCLGLSPAETALKVGLPFAAPFIISGTRISIATGTFALAAAEMAGAFEGLAHRVFYSHQMFQTDLMMAGVAVIAFLGFALDHAFARAARAALPWCAADTDELSE